MQVGIEAELPLSPAILESGVEPPSCTCADREGTPRAPWGDLEPRGFREHLSILTSPHMPKPAKAGGPEHGPASPAAHPLACLRPARWQALLAP